MVIFPLFCAISLGACGNDRTIYKAIEKDIPESFFDENYTPVIPKWDTARQKEAADLLNDFDLALRACRINNKELKAILSKKDSNNGT